MTTPAGWYPEPGADQQRYWDGERWTEHVAPLTPSEDAGARPEEVAVTPLSTADSTTSGAADGSGRGKLVGGIAAAVLVVAAGLFAFTQLASADGGADSPEAAVEDLMDAFSNEDVVGVAEVLLPGERRTYVDPYLEGVGHLQRWGVLDEQLDTSDVSGFEFQVDGLELQTETVADDIVNVYASGSLTAELNGEELPIGDVLSARMGDQDMSEFDEPSETSDFDDVMITTVREDGRWYVSAMFTIAEEMRADTEFAGQSAPAGIEPIGAPTPEAAIDGMVEAIESFDLDGVVARLNPDEAQVLQRYGPLFLPDQAEIDADVEADDVSLTIDLETEIEERDGIAVATFPSIRVQYADAYDSGEIVVDDDCVAITSDGETEEVCGDVTEGGSIDFTDTPAGDLSAMFDGMDTIGLVVAQHDGEWYVSPIGTYYEAFLSIMRAIDRDEFEAIVDALEDGSLEAWLEDEFENLLGEQFEEMLSSTEFDEIGEAIPGEDVDALVAECQAGDMASCDDLYWVTPVGSDEERVALTCGGTVELGDVSGGDCATGEPVFGDGATYGDDPELDGFWDGCEAGDMEACDDLFWSSGIGTEYEAFGESCGGRTEDAFGDCVSLLGEQVG